MTKSEFIAELANRLEYLSYKDAGTVVNTFFDSISEALGNGDKVELRGFGSFKVKERPSRIGRNPKTGQTVNVPAKKVPYFKPGKELKNLMDS
jgi:integration host factor subunit beta